MDKIYYLKRRDDDKCPFAKLVIKSCNGTTSFECDCSYITGWDTDSNPVDYSFFASAYCKFDGCTHWCFYGEDYPTEEDSDSYYHICGSYTMAEYLAMNCFVWEVARRYFEAMNINEDKYYVEGNEIKEFLKLFNTLYIIEKGEG